MRQLTRLAATVFNIPLMLTADAASMIASALADRWGVEPLMDGGEVASFVAGLPGQLDAKAGVRPAYRTENGVAIIRVHGELVNRGAWIGAASGLMSYEGLAAQLDAAASDPAVNGIILDFNSPGGQAAGAIETAAKIRALDARKPTVAFVDGQAASAAYALATGARKIVATPSAMLGSIGVVWMHLDRSTQLENGGVKPTLLTAGAYKVDGHSAAPLAAAPRARIQAQIDKVYSLLVDAVAAHRPIDASAVRATQAGVFIGSQAVASGLADSLGDMDDAFAAIRAAPPRSSFPTQPLRTSKRSDVTAFALDAHDRDATRSHCANAFSDGVLEGRERGARMERARILSILDAPAAKGREAQARHFAFKTGLSLEEVSAALEAAPMLVETSYSPLSVQMDTIKQFRVGLGGMAALTDAPRLISAQDIFARRKASAAVRRKD